MAGADIRSPQFLETCSKAMEKLQQFAANEFALCLPGCRIAGFSAEKKNGVTLQFDDFQGDFYGTDNRLDQFSNDRMAVREGFGVSRHVACVSANVGEDQQNRFRGSGGQWGQLWFISAQEVLLPKDACRERFGK